MSEYLKDSGHRWMRTCDECGGAFYCCTAGPEDEDDSAPDWMCETCTENDAEIARLRAALKPFAAFARKFDAKPLKGIADEFYGIHMGTEWAADLRLSDCRTALKALEEQGKPLSSAGTPAKP